MEEYPKKCHGCPEWTTTRKREPLCSKYREILTGLQTPLCLQPKNMTTDAIQQFVLENKKQIQDWEHLNRQAKDDIHRESSIIDERRKYIRDLEDCMSKYERALRRRQQSTPMTNAEMRNVHVRIKAITFHERGKKRWIDITFTRYGTVAQIPDFGRRLIQHSEGHSSYEGIGYPKSTEAVFQMRMYMDAIDPLVNDLHEVFTPWLLNEIEGKN